jgi:aspartyl/glutamyl-tRNA(Asn/Gln) amidotransferase C subunit
MPEDPDSCDPVELARLARLDLDERERTLFAGQLRRMIESFSRISDLPIDDVEPFACLADPLRTEREDEPAPGCGTPGLLTTPPLFGESRGGKR